jgi:hypothetical protein
MPTTVPAGSVVASPGAPAQAVSAGVAPGATDRPGALQVVALGAAAAAALAASDQVIWGWPAEWRRNGWGYERRLQVRGLQYAAFLPTELLFAAARREDLGYRPLPSLAADDRMRRAIWHGLTVGRADGTRGFPWPVLAGAVAGGLAAAPRLPAGERAYWVLSRPFTTFATRIALNAAREVMGRR